MNRQPIFDAVKQLRGGKAFTGVEVKALDAAIDEALGLGPNASGLSEPAEFYAHVRSALKPLNQTQVAGFETSLSAMGTAHWPLSWVAYALATKWHETNETMQPVREAYWLSEAWRKTHLRYWPWYGRGDVQLTWQQNYERADEELGLGGSLIANPDRALEPDIAAKVMVRGMEAGWFTNHKLADYLPLAGRGTADGYTNARRIINGTDRAAKIAGYAQAFEEALAQGGWA